MTLEKIYSMFTGIVECMGVLQDISSNGKGASIKISALGMNFNDVAIGDSIACNGVCVTVVKLYNQAFSADISHETMACTIFKNAQKGMSLNLEKALTVTTHMGGHIVQGHVDGVGEITSINKADDVIDVWITAPSEISHYIAKKGSITIDGISLTVNEVNGDDFRLTLIPHTHGVTTSDNWEKGQLVNIEVDVLARYMERLLSVQKITKKEASSELSMNTLIENGFF